MSESMSDLEKWSERIRNLLAKADSTEHEEEAATYRAKAEELMRKYRIVEEELIAADQFSILPVSKEIVISTSGSDFYSEHYKMWVHSVIHTGCRTSHTWKWINGKSELVATIVGYTSDIRTTEFLYQQAWLVMASRLEPKIDREQSDEENIYRLRSSGMTRRRVANLLWDLDTHASHSKVAKVYKAECERRGEEAALSGRDMSSQVYRMTYADSFADRYATRLRSARDMADSVGGLPDLHGRKERIDEAFFALFPDMRPETPEQKEARIAAEAEDNKGKKPGKALSKYKVTKKMMAENHRMRYSASAVAGRTTGHRAADSVEIDRTSKRAQRVEAGEPTRGSAVELGN